MGKAWISAVDIKARMANLDPRGIGISDDIKDELADRACAWIERECSIQVIRNPLVPFSFRFNGNRRGRLHLPYTPVRSILTLQINQTAVSVGTSSEYSAGTVQAFFDNKSVYYPPGFWAGVANVLVVWDAGYDLADVPAELKSLAESIAILMFKERDRWGDQLKNLPGQTVNFVREIPPQERATLNSFKEHRRYFEGFGGVPA